MLGRRRRRWPSIDPTLEQSPRLFVTPCSVTSQAAADWEMGVVVCRWRHNQERPARESVSIAAGERTGDSRAARPRASSRRNLF